MIAGTGLFGMPIYALARLVAASATFQAWCGVSNEDDALNRVHAMEASDRPESFDPMPRAVINHAIFKGAIKGAACQYEMGSLLLAFEATPSTEYTKTDDQFMAFVNTVSSVLQEMRDKSGLNLADGSGSYLNLRDIDLYEVPSPAIPDNEEGVEFFGVSFMVHWQG